jgi:hypothetical protein
MGVLDFLSGDPCSRLNGTDFRDIWISSTRTQAEAYPLIANAGALITFSSKAASAGADGNMLNSLTPNSSIRLQKFLSNGANTKLVNVLLRVNNNSDGNIIGLVDGYIVPSLGSTAYTYNTSSTPLLTQNKIWDSADETRITSTTGGTATTSILGKLLSEGVLLKKSELYDPNPTQGAQPTLIEIYKRIHSGETVSTEVEARKTTLESKNLRFFAAFLAEYCFYRTRYIYMLKEFFTVFNSSVTPFTLATPVKTAIIATGGPATPTQQQALTAMAVILSQLNTRMNDMLRILNALNAYYSGILTQVSSDINSTTASFGSNRGVEEAVNALRASEQGINSNMSEADFKKEAVRYMKEKNQYGNMLLGLYTFLNLSALAILYKVYKSS